MRKKAAKMAALMLTAAMALTACGGSGQSTGNGGGNTSAGGNAGSGSSTQAEESDKNAIKDLVTYEAPNREQEGFFILNTEKAADLNILCNLYAPLIEVDENGKLRPAVAKEWGTEDGGLTWTFKLRDER